MRLTLTFFLLQITIWSATVTVCDSGCSYATASIQTAINSRACGDHVQLKAQANPYPPFYLPGGNSIQCGANPIYVENFAMSSLPPTGSLITPAYASLLPNIQATSGTPMVLYTHNGGLDCGGGSNHCPANGWVIQGLRFSQTTTRGQSPCYISLGAVSSACATDTALIVQADMPTNITFRSNYIQTSPYNVTRRGMNFDVYLGTVRDNWFDCISPTLMDGGTGDSQCLVGGPVGTSTDRVLVANNMFIGGTETVTWGAYPAAVKTPVLSANGAFGWLDQTTVGAQYVDLIGNHIQHDPYALTVTWAANTWYRIGQAIVSSTGAGPVFIAVSTGKSGGSEPNWAGTGVNSNLTDGTITWRHVDNQWNATDGVTGLLCGYSVKNHWESKSLLFGRISNNFLDRLWSQCAAFGNQGRSLVPEVQTAGNGGGAASNIQNVELSNNIGTNLSGAFGTVFSLTPADGNRWPRFLGSVVEPYTINAGNQTLKISVDGGAASTITLITGTRTAKQVADDINAAAITNVMAVPFDVPAGSAAGCTTSSTTCRVLIQRGANPSLTQPTFSTDNPPLPWNAAGVAISISPATGTTATTVLGLPANGTTITACTNPQSLVWYGCGQGANVSFTNNLFQMRHDGSYQPFVNYIGLINSGIDGFNLDHNLLTDSGGWYSGIAQLIIAVGYPGSDGVGHSGEKNMLLQNNIFQDISSKHYIGTTDGVSHLDWAAINYGCQTAAPNPTWTTGGDQAAQCDAAHLKGGFTKNLAYGLPYTNGYTGIGTCLVAGLTCNSNPADGNSGAGAQPNDNPNADHFSSLSFLQAIPGNTAQPDYTLAYNASSPQKYMQPANFGNDKRPLGPDMTQMNFVRLAGGAPTVSDRAAIFTLNIAPPLMAKSGMATVAIDPFCFSPVADMDPAQFPNPGWTDADRFPQFAAQRVIVAGLNAPLSPGTTYYYCIEYQGYGLQGSFVTGAALSGVRTIQVQTSLTNLTQGATGATNMIVEYGTTYSRATDTLTGGGTTTAVACVVGGGTCAASFTATAGTPIFYRYKIRNAGGTVLITQPVTAQVAQ